MPDPFDIALDRDQACRSSLHPGPQLHRNIPSIAVTPREASVQHAKGVCDETDIIDGKRGFSADDRVADRARNI
jgi:hypothetical protein